MVIHAGSSLFICFELFASGKSTVPLVVRKCVSAVNVACRQQNSWPVEERLQQIQCDFGRLIGLPAVARVVDATHFSISKCLVSHSDYFYYKKIVTAKKRFLDVYVSMPGTLNDAQV